MNCHDIRERLVDYLTGDADPAARDEIQEHVAACAACREELESITLAWTKLGVLPEQKPSPDLRTRFYTMLESYKDLRNGDAAEFPARNAAKPASRFASWWPRVPAVQMALSALFLAVGLLAGSLLKSGPGPASRMARLEAELGDMRQQVSLSLLDRPSPSDRLNGLSFAARVQDPNPRTIDALLNTLDSDPNVNVRVAATDALYLFRDTPGVREGLVRSLSRQTSPLVQIALINLLADIKEAQAAQALKSLVENRELAPEVRSKAEWGLKNII